MIKAQEERRHKLGDVTKCADERHRRVQGDVMIVEKAAKTRLPVFLFRTHLSAYTFF